MVPALARALEKCRDVPERQAALQAERNRRDLLSQSVAKQIEELISVYGRSEEFARRASSELALKACDATNFGSMDAAVVANKEAWELELAVDDDEDDGMLKESRVGTAMSDLTNKR